MLFVKYTIKIWSFTCKKHSKSYPQSIDVIYLAERCHIGIYSWRTRKLGGAYEDEERKPLNFSLQNLCLLYLNFSLLPFPAHRLVALALVPSDRSRHEIRGCQMN